MAQRNVAILIKEAALETATYMEYDWLGELSG